MSLVLALSLTMLTVDKVKEGAWAISTAGGSSEWSPSSPLWEQMRATEWQCVRHQTLAGHHINHFGERIRVHQGHNLPVLPIFRPSHDLPIISCFRPFHGLPFPCHFSTSASQGPFWYKGSDACKLAQEPCQKDNGLRHNIINPCFNRRCVWV